MPLRWIFDNFIQAKQGERDLVNYLPFENRTPDSQYRTLLHRIMSEGKMVAETQMEEGALRVIGHQFRFDLANGFPLITERDLLDPGQNQRPQFEMAIAELCAFLNGARTLDEMYAFGCSWWKPWGTKEKCEKRGLKEGDLGPGSYGAAWRSFPTADPEIVSEIARLAVPMPDLDAANHRLIAIGTALRKMQPFDQLLHLLQQMRELPHLRTHILTPFIPQYIGRGKGKQQKVVVVPCHGLVHVFVDPQDKELSLLHWQRSADAPVGLVFNLIQYAALTLMLAQVMGYTARELVFQTSDTHIYASGPNDQQKDVKDMLAAEPQRLPTVILNPKVTDLFAFRPHHFTVTDYHPQLGRRRIRTPV